jgi:hypothetical protein
MSGERFNLQLGRRVESKKVPTLGVGAHACNSSNGEAEAGGSCIQGHPVVHGKRTTILGTYLPRIF